MSVRHLHAACPHDCPDTCAIDVQLEGERIVHLQGHPAHAHTHGALCTKVSRYTERLQHPDRLLTPLRRVGPKGAGRFEPIAWDAALDLAAQRLGEIAARAPEAIVPYSYSGTLGLVQGEGMASRFFNALGASRLARTICAEAGGQALERVYGRKWGTHVQNFQDSRLILIWGSNSVTSNLHFWTYAQRAKRAGARLVCIDPRRTETAERCHEHVALRPGTDGALALAMMQVLVNEDLLDHDYLERHTRGWPALRERALPWPPERAAEVCGVPAEQIVELARAWGRTRPAAIRLNYGMQRVHGGGNAVRLIAALPCLTGAWRDPAGGLLLSSSGFAKAVVDRAALERPELLKDCQPRTVNMSTIGADLLREGSPGFGPRIEALLVYNANPLASNPDAETVRRGFLREDLFTVVMEHFLTDTADHADLVLPATMQLEHFDVHTSYGHTDVLVSEACVPAPGLALPNTEIFRRLAARMGLDDPALAEDDITLARQALGRSLDFDALRAQGWASLDVPPAPFAQGFPTPDGRAVLSEADDVPDHRPNFESAEADPERAQRYPLALISPPCRHFLNSTFANLPSLRALGDAQPTLEMNLADAEARGVRDGDAIEVWNDRARVRFVARVGPRARPGVVNAMGVWWPKLSPGGRNVNALTSPRLTDLGEAPTFHDCLVEVRRASEPA